jgi:hypothetical protein
MRLAGLLLACAVACSSSHPRSKEPRTARDKQLREARANGEVDPPASKWAGWRYQGDRADCFYVLGRRCFKTEKAACAAAKCKKKCEISGGGPAAVTCEK